MATFRRALPALGIALIAMLVAPAGALASPARRGVATPWADYQFQNTLASTDGVTPSLIDIGKGNAFATETVDGASRTVLQFRANHGLALRPIPSRARDEYSIVILARLKTIPGYARLIDFKNGTVDTGLYSDDGALNFYDDASGTQTPIRHNQYFQVVLTCDEQSRIVVGYVNGKQQFSFQDDGLDAVVGGRHELRFFADDNAVPDEASAGAVARIRVYQTVLSPRDVAALDREPLG
jgi:hypothetical protein